MHDLTNQLVSALAALMPQDLDRELLLLLGLGLMAVLLALTLAALFYGLQQRTRYRAALSSQSLLTTEFTELQTRHRDLEIRWAKLVTLFRSERRYQSERQKLAAETRHEMGNEFSNLAQRIFEEKNLRFQNMSRDRLEALLTPLQQQLTSFKQEMQDLSRHDSHERNSLKGEILQLRELNQSLNQEAANLTRALKGSNKSQGNWGEMILERSLEIAGLRQGIEYDSQASFRDTEGRLQRPDLVIRLPEGRQVVVDAKVSLIAWEQLVSSERQEEQQQHLAELCRSLREHANGLAARNYPAITDLNSLDFVLMFLPVEAAFGRAITFDQRLLEETLAKGIVLVTPSTLLATLRLIANLWRLDRQNSNAREIARRAGSLYDRFRLFATEMEKIGRTLSNCQQSYETACNRLYRGRGNLVSQAQALKELGAQTNQELPATMVETADAAEKN